MKKKMLFWGLVLALSFSLLLMAADGKWTGWITDEHCGSSGAKADHKECALKCVSEGKKLVFYNNSDKKIYPLDNQDLAKANLGHEVVVHGSLQDGAIKVAKIDPAKK
jgi:hypothetical protein